MVTLPEGRPTACFIDLNALSWNFRQIRSKVGPNIKILSMVKANGYGHGATAIAKALAAEGSDAFGVATAEEAIELRRAGIGTPILVLAGAYPDQVDQFFDNSLTPVIHASASLEELDAIVHRRKKALNVHLEIDTGMGRIGLVSPDLREAVAQARQIATLPGLAIDSVGRATVRSAP